MKDSCVLVTGVCGFIGSRLARRLILEGAEVVGVDDLSTGTIENISGLGVEFHELDVSSRQIRRLLEHDFVRHTFNYIFHFGSPCSVVQFNRDPTDALLSTVNGFRSMAKLSSYMGAKLIYPSSGNIYGLTQPQHEVLPPQPINLYGAAKLICEYMADTEWATGLRIFLGYGPGEEHKGELASVVHQFIKAVLADEPPIVFGDGGQRRDFIYIDDVISGIVKAAEQDMLEVVNVGSGKAYSFNELLTIIGDCAGKRVEPKYVGKPSGYVEDTCADTTQMKRFLDLHPISLEEGVRRTIRHYRAREKNIAG